MALANQKQIEELANSLTECANSIHERLMKAITAKEVSQDQARATFDDEASLRQRANALYIDAAKCVAGNLKISQESLTDVVGDAKDKIKEIRRISTFLDLVADLLALAIAAYSAKPNLIIAAFKEVKNDVDAIAEV
jgi:hypothetical protein